MKVLFLCPGGSSCRSLIAKTILQSFDSDMEVFSASVKPVDCSQFIIEMMATAGYKLDEQSHPNIDTFLDLKLDYLITVYDGINEKLAIPQLQYVHKLHLDFADPEKLQKEQAERLGAYNHLLEEIKTELHYFYHRILKRSQ